MSRLWEQFTPDQPRADLAVVAAESDGNFPILLPFLAIPAHTAASTCQGGFDGRGQPTASPMLTAIMSGGVGISGRELYKYR